MIAQGNPAIYKNPDDISTVQVGGRKVARARSYALNDALNACERRMD